MTPTLYVGLMSGTSLDGVDAVLAEFEEEPALISGRWFAYPQELKQALLSLHRTGADELDRALRLGNHLADLYAAAVVGLLQQAGVPPERVRAIGCHGQTVRHQPALGYSLQINNPARLAERTGITVVADFRSRDIAAGGQGGPLLPAFHAARFRHPKLHRVIVNVGGIASLTDLPPEGRVIGFDCGPGNLLMDAWAKRHWGCDYDPGGGLAAQGKVQDRLLRDLLTHPFFSRSPPKCASREVFNQDWLGTHLRGDERPEDVLSTLLELTVRGIVHGVRQHCPGAQEVWLCGGGAHNEELLRRLGLHLPNLRVGTSAELGVTVDWVEAYAFAWLARQTLAGLPGNLPEATGAKGPRILGAIYPP